MVKTGIWDVLRIDYTTKDDGGNCLLQKYYEDSKSNAAFVRCVDIMTRLIQKYGTQVLEGIDGKSFPAVEAVGTNQKARHIQEKAA